VAANSIGSAEHSFRLYTIGKQCFGIDSKFKLNALLFFLLSFILMTLNNLKTSVVVVVVVVVV